MDHQHRFIEMEGSDSATPSIFTCSRCKELGTKQLTNYICESRLCNYIIHKQCLVLTLEQAIHPFFKNSHFKLCEKASDGGFCDACGKDLLGVFYWCTETGYALHPCCLKLSDKYDCSIATMKLCPEVPLDCALCNKRHVVRNQFQGWSYVFDYFDHSPRRCFHVSCFNDFILKQATRSKGGMRSAMKFTGKLALGIFQAGIGEFSSIFTIGEAVISAISSD